MDHRRIEEMSIPDLYATGRLSLEDEEAYETHLLECRECREQVAWADDFGTSMRTVAVEEAAHAAAQVGFLVWLARRGSALRLGLTAALLALAALPAWLLVERSSLQGELAEARAALERPAPAPVPSVQPAPQGPDEATKAELARLNQEHTRLVADLNREREAHQELSDRLAGIMKPQANTYTASLGVVRGLNDTGEVLLGSVPEWINLSLELPDVEYDVYRATFYDAATGRKLWQSDLKPTRNATLDTLVYSDRLKPGKYQVTIEGMNEGGAVPVGQISFLVHSKG
jgi:hypothetical protein